jgi:cytochrome c553
MRCCHSCEEVRCGLVSSTFQKWGHLRYATNPQDFPVVQTGRITRFKLPAAYTLRFSGYGLYGGPDVSRLLTDNCEKCHGVDGLGRNSSAFPKLAKQNPNYFYLTMQAAIERGKQIAERGIPSQRVPICMECHGPGPDRKNPNYPELAGQYAEYLILQLTLFKQQRRGGTAYAHLMRRVAHGLTPRQMRDVASYYESLSPNSGTEVR